jgi:hypothetical protein
MNSQTIAVTAEPGDVLNLLSHTFSTGHTVVFELLQNAARAGATRVTLTHALDTLVVEDDGTGISDFAKLLAIAKSGWSEEVMRSELPYGSGFISALFACTKLMVESGYFGFSAVTEHLRACKPVLVSDANRPVSGTRITMEGLGFGDLSKILADKLKGFPIDVEYNGTLIARPHARGAGFVPTAVGDLLLDLSTTEAVAYLQGFQILSMFGDWYAPKRSVLHLDASIFRGRMPDRQSLIDPDEARSRVAHVIAHVARQQLTALKASLDGREFVKRHAADCSRWDAMELLDDVPWIPRDWLIVFNEAPRLSRWQGEWNELVARISNDAIHQDDVPPLVVEIDQLYDGDEDPFTTPMYLYAKGVPMIETSLRDTHWLSPRVKRADELDVKVTSEPLKSAQFNASYFSVDVGLHESIQLEGPLGPVVLDRSDAVYDGDVLHITNASDSGCLNQISAYQDEERWDERCQDEDEEAFNRLQSILSDVAPEVVIAGLLRGHRNELMTLAAGKSFTVTIDETRGVVVTASDNTA